MNGKKNAWEVRLPFFFRYRARFRGGTCNANCIAFFPPLNRFLDCASLGSVCVCVLLIKLNAQGIALIPFADERRLRRAVADIDLERHLSTREKARNATGVDLQFAYAPDNEAETVPSTLPRSFPNLTRACSRVRAFECPPIPRPGRFVPALCPGVQQPYAGFPSLQYLPHVVGRLARAAVNVFGRPSVKDSMLLTVGDADALAVLTAAAADSASDGAAASGAAAAAASASAAAAAATAEAVSAALTPAAIARLAVPAAVGARHPVRSAPWERARLGYAIASRAAARWLKPAAAVAAGSPPQPQPQPTCFVQWPIVREALVCKISACSGHLFSAHATYPVVEMDADGCDQWAQDAAAAHEKSRTARGVEIGTVYAMAHVRVLQGMRRAADGSVRKYFGEDGDEEEVVPLQLVLPERPARPDARFIELRPQRMADAFPLQCEVVYIGGEHPHLYGSTGIVRAHGEPASDAAASSATTDASAAPRVLSVDVNVSPPEPAFGAHIARTVREQSKYHASHVVARRLGVSAQALSKLTSSVFVQPGRLDLGLNLKLHKQNLLVPGYARRQHQPHPWEELTGARVAPVSALGQNSGAATMRVARAHQTIAL